LSDTPFRLVTFDVYSAMFDIRRSLVPVIKKELGRHGIDAAEFLKIWRETQLRYLQLDTLLSRGRTSFRELTRLSLMYTCARSGVRLDGDAKSLVAAWEDLTPYEDVGSTLMELRREGYDVGLLSNGDRDMLHSLAGRLAVKPRYIFSAEDAGVYKPHPKMYSQAVELTGLGVEEVVHVAGGSTDVVGSKSFGFFTVWVNRSGSVGETLPFQADETISTLVQLAAKLKR
jgi:2-haloacid dehalogenase